MIQCEWGRSYFPHGRKKCPDEAHFIVKFLDGHPIMVPFEDFNFVCERHLKQLKKIEKRIEVYEFQEYHEKVQFT